MHRPRACRCSSSVDPGEGAGRTSVGWGAVEGRKEWHARVLRVYIPYACVRLVMELRLKAAALSLQGHNKQTHRRPEESGPLRRQAQRVPAATYMNRVTSLMVSLQKLGEPTGEVEGDRSGVGPRSTEASSTASSASSRIQMSKKDATRPGFWLAGTKTTWVDSAPAHGGSEDCRGLGKGGTRHPGNR